MTFATAAIPTRLQIPKFILYCLMTFFSKCNGAVEPRLHARSTLSLAQFEPHKLDGRLGQGRIRFRLCSTPLRRSCVMVPSKGKRLVRHRLVPLPSRVA